MCLSFVLTFIYCISICNIISTSAVYSVETMVVQCQPSFLGLTLWDFQNQSLPQCLLKKLLALHFLASYLLNEMEGGLSLTHNCSHVLKGPCPVSNMALAHLITGLLWLWHCNYPYRLLEIMVKVRICKFKSYLYQYNEENNSSDVPFHLF